MRVFQKGTVVLSGRNYRELLVKVLATLPDGFQPTLLQTQMPVSKSDSSQDKMFQKVTDQTVFRGDA